MEVSELDYRGVGDPDKLWQVYWGSQSFDAIRSQAKNSTQPFV